MSYAPKIIGRILGRAIHLNRQPYRAGSHPHLYVPRIYFSDDRGRKPVGIACGEKDAKPNIRIGFPRSGNREGSTSNAAGRRIERVRMVVRIVEGMMFEQYLPRERARTEDTILGITCHNVMPIHSRT